MSTNDFGLLDYDAFGLVCIINIIIIIIIHRRL
jgi:hypothetical protein